jgi:D-alanyl-D-alanine carboxypeptidase/D-alanyl-D-alanine-endopeptidase (penicillin-binding protein 4)
MVRVLVAEAGRLPGMLRERAPRRADGRPALPPGTRMVAKTGTLNFVSALAGYVEVRGRRLAFAIFAADPAARARLPEPVASDAPGAGAWEGRARAQEAALVRRWAMLAG